MKTLQMVGVRTRLAFRERDVFGVGLPKGKNSKHRTAPQRTDWKRAVSFRSGVPADWETLGIRKGARENPKTQEADLRQSEQASKDSNGANMIFAEHHWNLRLCHLLDLTLC